MVGWDGFEPPHALGFNQPLYQLSYHPSNLAGVRRTVAFLPPQCAGGPVTYGAILGRVRLMNAPGRSRRRAAYKFVVVPAEGIEPPRPAYEARPLPLRISRHRAGWSAVPANIVPRWKPTPRLSAMWALPAEGPRYAEGPSSCNSSVPHLASRRARSPVTMFGVTICGVVRRPMISCPTKQLDRSDRFSFEPIKNREEYSFQETNQREW
jgi:hypothetical protein